MNEREITAAAIEQVSRGRGPDTFAFANHVRRLFVKPDDQIGRLLHASIGVAGEAGELLDTIKKTWVYGKPLDRDNLLEECGDALFYLVAMLDSVGLTLDEAMAHNVIKLGLRYPQGYSDQAARERADKSTTDACGSAKIGEAK